jgi:hypothetical protein
VDLQVFVDLLHGFAGLHGKSSPQGRMAINERLKRASQGRNVYLGADARGKTDMVNRALRCELV